MEKLSLLLWSFAVGLACSWVSSATASSLPALDCLHPDSPVPCNVNGVSSGRASSSGYDNAQMKANDHEYLMEKTSSLLDLFYESDIPKRVAKLVNYSGSLKELQRGLLDGTEAGGQTFGK